MKKLMRNVWLKRIWKVQLGRELNGTKKRFCCLANNQSVAGVWAHC
jgi:hypothetical protein